MYRPVRAAWGLVAIGAATAVGITTQNPGFIVITFLGTLALPRVLGLSPRRWNRHGFGPHGFGAHGAGCSGRSQSESTPTKPTAQTV